MGNKGGGAAGAVSYPDYIMNVHADWLGVDPTDALGAMAGRIELDVVDVINSLLGGADADFATCTITSTIANNINNDEGFILVDYAGDVWVFKFNKDGGGTTSGYEIVITTGDSAVVVAAATEAIISGTALFQQSVSGAVITVQQVTKGLLGNRPNRDLVVNAGFVITDFTGGGNVVNPYSGVSAYNPAADINEFMSDVATYRAFAGALNPPEDFDSHVTKALSRTSASEFPAENITEAVTAIVSSAITDAGSAVTSARTLASTTAATAITAAISAATDAIDSAPVTEMIEQFRRRAETAHLKSVSRYTGGMADINAVQSSAFLFGLALMEAEHVERVEEFVAKLSMQIYMDVVPAYLQMEVSFSADHLTTFRERTNTQLRVQGALDAQVRKGRDAFMIQAVNELAGALAREGDSKKTATVLSAEAGRLKFVALGERDKQDMLYDIEEWLWELKLFQYGSNVLSGVSTGGQVLPERPSQMSSILSGAFAGAGVGAAAGAPVGGIGAGPGAVIGGVIGGIGGYFEGNY